MEKVEAGGSTVGELQKFLPFVPALLVFWGVIRLSFYYGNFSLPIYSFLEFSEIITSFFDVIIVITYLISCFLILFVIISSKETIRRYLVQTLFLYAFVPATGEIIFRNQNVRFDNWMNMAFMLLTPLVAYLIAKMFSSKSISKYSAIILAMTVFILLSMVGLWILSSFEAREVKKGKKYIGVLVYFKDSTEFKPDSNHYYIGQTKNYIFFYDQLNKRTRARKIEDVKMIEYSERKEQDLPPLPLKP